MSKAVVILGAGASADFGVPTLQSIFKDKQARRYLNEDDWLLRKLDELFWNQRAADLETSDQSLTIEEMLTVLRDWEKEPDADSPGSDMLSRFRKSLYILIHRAVFVGKSSGGGHLNPLIRACRRKFERTTWATFNWDCIFEASFWYSKSYGSRYNPAVVVDLQNWKYASSQAHELLKLHGGVNWWMINNTLTYLQFGAGGDLERNWREYAEASDPSDMPVILEPSVYKYDDPVYRLLEPQWKIFFKRLTEADIVIIIGYSLPEADTQARSKILTAFQINQGCQWLIVNPSDSSISRYRRLLGSLRVKVLQNGLAGFNNDILANLQEAFPTIDFSED